ncbi:hypothetical protein [Nostoc sp. ChiQUE01b]|uniref:hypothetical protein n=1 Tax=Nostoc sp. ChiQUE01b TaxID=3075376 RepID=UPI002AD458E0|nr:hypothetical protein [Nostoc sp. ChiQUE01b]MDZ8261716.1 hypothetical protein [Nostoc sp. ChiQUE01b]
MNEEWVASMMCWFEGFARGKELADFLATAPEVGTPEGAKAFVDFRAQQYERWIEGNQQPPPINSIDDIDPRLRTPELEGIFKMIPIEAAIDQGGYSVMDVLSGRAMIDVLNEIDPENSYSLVCDDDFENDEIYE